MSAERRVGGEEDAALVLQPLEGVEAAVARAVAVRPVVVTGREDRRLVQRIEVGEPLRLDRRLHGVLAGRRRRRARRRVPGFEIAVVDGERNIWLFMSSSRFGTPFVACVSEYGMSPHSPIAYWNVLSLPLPMPATANPAAVADTTSAANSTSTSLGRDMLPPRSNDPASLSRRAPRVGSAPASMW
jgi:hypothetical protein